MKIIYSLLTVSLFFVTSCNQDSEKKETEEKEADKVEEKKVNPKETTDEIKSSIDLSQELLNRIKSEEDHKELIERYKKLDLEKLSKELDTDTKKLAFWVNTYNGFIQHILGENPELFEDRNAFFKKEQVNIGGELISFDKIEHGIIRSSTMKLSLGYLPKLFPGELERDLRVEEKDERIHFILNCGAKDCPPVYTYSEHTLDKDFDKVASTYLSNQTKIDTKEEIITSSALIQYFLGDFGGKKGAKEMLHKYEIINEKEKDYKLKYGEYDWSLALKNFG